MGSDQRTAAATALVLGVVALSAVDTVIVRILAPDLHPFVIVFFRSLFGLLWIAPWILRNRQCLSSHYAVMHVVRAGLKMLSLAAFFTAIALATLADVTAIAFTTPMFVTLGAWVFLNETPVLRRVLAVLLSFIGVFIILQPGQGEWATPLLFALAGAVLAAIIQLMLKSMSARDSSDTLVAWNLIATVPMAALPLYWFWSTPTAGQLLLLSLQGAIGVCNMTLMTRAMALAEASYLAPFDFLRLPVIALLGYLFFSEFPTSATVIGAAVIFLSSLLLTGWSARIGISRADRR